MDSDRTEVHRKGCADLTRGANSRRHQMTVGATTADEVVEVAWADFLTEGSVTWEQAQDMTRFLPCWTTTTPCPDCGCGPDEPCENPERTNMTAMPDHEQQMTRAQRRHTAAQAKADQAKEDMVNLVKAAHQDGWSEYRLAEVLGVQRQTVRKWLGK